jgi:integrase
MARDNIRRLPSGNFQARYRHPHTKETVSRTFPRRAAARDWLNAQRVDLQRGTWLDPRHARVTLGDFAESWLAAHQVKPRTRTGYRTDLDVHILPSLGGLPLESVTSERVRAWVAERRATGRDGAAAKAYRTLRTIMNAAVADGVIVRSPCNVAGADKAPEREVRPLLLDELWAVHGAMDDRHKAWVLVAGFCGLRWGEAVALRISDVDLDDGVVRVIRQARETSGGHVFEPPKPSASRRTVGLPSFVKADLEKHMENYTGGGADELVFTTSVGTALRNSNFRRRQWASATQTLTWRPRIHDLRHTCASLAISAGVDIKTLQRMLGHASAAMTLDRYGHLMGNPTAAVAAAMSAYGPKTTVIPGS